MAGPCVDHVLADAQTRNRQAQTRLPCPITIAKHNKYACRTFRNQCRGAILYTHEMHMHGHGMNTPIAFSQQLAVMTVATSQRALVCNRIHSFHAIIPFPPSCVQSTSSMVGSSAQPPRFAWPPRQLQRFAADGAQEALVH